MQFDFKYDTSKRGLHTLLKDYENEALKVMWVLPDKQFSSREVWEAVNVRLGDKKTISRASIINFLQYLAEARILEINSITGKGGHRGLYKQKYTETEFKKLVAEILIERLQKNFPGETREALEKVIGAN